MKPFVRSFFICFAVFIVSMILTFVIVGKDAWLFMDGFSANTITIVTPEYRKMQWDAIMAHPWLILPAVLCLAAVLNVFYSFWVSWNKFGKLRSENKFGPKNF